MDTGPGSYVKEPVLPLLHYLTTHYSTVTYKVDATCSTQIATDGRMEEVVDLTVETNPIHRIELFGEPQALPRPRTSWKSKQRHYNPASKELKAFKEAVKATIPQTTMGFVYPKGVAVSLTLICYMKRPNTDFTNGQRGMGRLKAMLPWTRPQVPDIDNLAKFALDGLNNLMYEDDRQVVKLLVLKLLDNDAECQGRTVVLISAFDPEQELPLIEG